MLLDIFTGKPFDAANQHLGAILDNLPSAFVTLLVGLLVIRVISWIASWLVGFVRMPKGLKEIIISLLDALLGIFLAIVVLQSLGLNNLALVFSAFVAAAGIAVGSGTSALVSDIFAGIYLARDRDFSIGDLVQVGEDKTEGEIISMDMRRTRVRDKKGAVHSLPNSVIERKEYVLMTKKRDRPDA